MKHLLPPHPKPAISLSLSGPCTSGEFSATEVGEGVGETRPSQGSPLIPKASLRVPEVTLVMTGVGL